MVRLIWCCKKFGFHKEFSPNKTESKGKSKINNNSSFLNCTLLAVLAADLLALTGDTTATWTSPMFIKLNSSNSSINPLHRAITDQEESWIASILSIGAIIGPFPFGLLSHRFGRKIGMLSIAIPHCIAYSLVTFADNIYLYYISRFISGLALGGGYTLLPMYVAEVAEDSNRGSLSSTLNVFWTLGNLIPLAIGPFISAFYFNLVLTVIPVVFFLVFIIAAPETPYYLLSKNRTESAENVLMSLRNKNREGIKYEMHQIEKCLEIENENEGRFIDLFNSKIVMKALIISNMLIIFQQLSGINAVLMYVQPMIEESGSSLSSELSSVLIGLVLFISSFSTPLVADKFGRKTLLIISDLGAMTSLFVFGAYLYIYENTDIDTRNISWIPVVMIIFYIITFNLALGPLSWTVASELFPSNVKSISASLTAFSCWLVSYFITQFYTSLNNAVGTAVTFWMFGGCCFAAAVFTYFCVPETKGKSFTDIQNSLGGEDNKGFEG